MADKTSKINTTKEKRLSKGKRKHIRRLKQAAGKDGTVYSSQKVRHAPEKSTGE